MYDYFPQKLMLQNNSLSSLPSSLLSPLDSLLLLNLSSNALTHSTLGIIVSKIIHFKNKIMITINIIISSNALAHSTLGIIVNKISRTRS